MSKYQVKPCKVSKRRGAMSKKDEFFKAFPDGPLQWFWTNDGEARVVDTATNRVVAEMRTQSPYSDQAKAVAIGLAHSPNLVNILTLIVEAHGKNDNNKLDVLIGVAQNGLNIMHDEFDKNEGE